MTTVLNILVDSVSPVGPEGFMVEGRPLANTVVASVYADVLGRLHITIQTDNSELAEYMRATPAERYMLHYSAERKS